MQLLSVVLVKLCLITGGFLFSTFQPTVLDRADGGKLEISFSHS